MVTVKQVASLIGQNGEYTIDGLTIPVNITDVRVVYGRLQVQLTPKEGTGKKWVEWTTVRGLSCQ